MILKKAAAFAAAVILGGALAGCATEEGGGKIEVFVSIPPQAEQARAVCGDLADLKTLIPSGYSPETYEPAPRDIAELTQADIYFTIGVPAEEANVLPRAEGIKISHLEEAAAREYPDLTIGSERDPHIWLSPKRMAAMTAEMAEQMASLDPENADYYRDNANAYISRLTELEEYASGCTAGLENKKFIVFHPAFGYLADEFGLEMYALEEGGREATAPHLADMIDLAKSEGIDRIFCQKEAGERQAESFAEEIGGTAVYLSPLAENYIENYKTMIDLICGREIG